MPPTPDLAKLAMAPALAVVACGDPTLEPDPPDVQSAYIDLYLDEDIRVCAGQLDAYDHFVERAFDLWTGDAPGDFHARIHAVHDASEHCIPGTSCASSTTPDAWVQHQVSQYHELFHVIHVATDGRSAPVLAEGIATAVGATTPILIPAAGLADLSPDLLLEEWSASEGQGIAALLARFLIDAYGPDAFRAYFRAMSDPERREPADFEREFEVAFGESLDAVWPVFAGEPRCTYDFWYCDSREVVEVFEESLEIDGFECDDPAVMGFSAPLNPDQTSGFDPYRIVHLHVSTERRYQIESRNTGPSWFARCDCLPTKSKDFFIFEPGTYAFVVYNSPSEEGDWGPPYLSVTPIEEPPADPVRD